MRLVDADALYGGACSLEAQALDYCGKLIERDGEEVSTEWRVWSAILAERSAFKHDVFDAPTVDAEPVNHWIPCSERLPEEDKDVLISYRYKEGEGDTSHVEIDITSYGTVCFGGRQIHALKEWRQPFDYFHANYEVVAWMPLPKPYREDRKDEAD